MTDMSFGLIDFIDDRLEKHKDKLGPLHRPLSIFLGSIIFLMLLAAIIGLPISLFKDINYVVLAQFGLIAVYFMLLLTIKQNVYDRFTFSLALFIVVTAGPVMVSTAGFLKVLTPVNEQVAGLLSQSNTVEVFFYSFLRGLGNVMWALPMLFMFFTFFPVYEKAGPQVVKKRYVSTCRVAFVFLILAMILVPWLDGAGKGVAELPEDLGILGDEIHGFQLVYLIFLAAYLLAGFSTIIAARLLSKGNDKRWLWIVTSGLLASQILYMVSDYNDQQIALRFPGSRTTADFVDAFESANGTVVFTNPRLHNISKARYESLVTYAICEGKSGEFSFKVTDKTDFDTEFTKINLASLRINDPLKFFCPIEDE